MGAPALADARRPRADLLAKLALFLSTTGAFPCALLRRRQSRSRVYRVCQYGAKTARWALSRTWQLPSQRQASITAAPAHASQLEPAFKAPKSAPGVASRAPPPPDCADDTSPRARRRRAVVAALSRVEMLFGDARKVFRLLQFLEMADMFRRVDEQLRAVRVLRRLRIACFFLFYALENWMLIQLRVRGLAARDPRVKWLKRALNGFWCLSILLAFPIDRLTGRGGALSTIKKLLDLPVAYIAFSDHRVSDGLFGALGLASGFIGVHLRWTDVVAMQSPRLS